MRIGIYQSHIEWENKKENINKLEKYLNTKGTEKADIIFLPEMSFTGFSMNADITSESDNSTVNVLSELCRMSKTAIGFGWIREMDGVKSNVYTVMDKKGKIISEYAKIHPFFPEQNLIARGEKISHFNLEGISFSTFICYDLRFPEIFRISARMSHVIVVPANWPKSRREQWITLLKARAIENQVYVIGVNCVGEIGGTIYSGDSCFVKPDGQIAISTAETEEMFAYDFIDDIATIRKEFPVWEDSRPAFYAGLYSEVAGNE